MGHKGAVLNLQLIMPRLGLWGMATTVVARTVSAEAEQVCAYWFDPLRVGDDTRVVPVLKHMFSSLQESVFACTW